MSESTPPAQPVPPTPRRAGGLLAGLILGVAVGAAAVGVAWAFSASTGSDGPEADPVADAEAVCGVIERTPVAKDAKDMENLSLEDIRRWGVAEVGPSLAKQNPDLKPLGDAMQKVLPAIQTFDIEKANEAIDQVKELCADL
jgi:hypothetical protein